MNLVPAIHTLCSRRPWYRYRSPHALTFANVHLMRRGAAMTITFSVGSLLGFLVNQRLTLQHRGDLPSASKHLVRCYPILYLINFVGPWVTTRRLSVPGQTGPARAISALTLLAFAMQNLWTFQPIAGVRGHSPARNAR